MPKHIDNLLASVNKHKGYAHPNRFSIEFPDIAAIAGDKGREFEFFCESTSIPGRQILTNDYTGRARQSIKKPNGYQNEDVSFIFNLTNDYFIRDVFDKWTNLVVNRETYEVGYKQEYCTKVLIHQLDEEDTRVYTVELRDAYPVTVQNIDLNSTTESAIQKFNVTMTYTDFREIKGEPIGLFQPDFTGDSRQAPKPNRNGTQISKSDASNFVQDRTPSGGPLPNKGDVIQRRRAIPTIVPFLPPKVNRINRIARIFGIIPGPE